MPTKPTKAVIDAAKRKLNPRDVLRVVINETPELHDALKDQDFVRKED